MLRRLFPVILLCLWAINGFSQKESPLNFSSDPCLNPVEQELARLINAYRAEKGLPAIKLSASLCYVARTHALDQTANHIYGDKCNLHSWSQNARWSSCCYTPDHKMASCMWNKPRELTSYRGDGFEIAFYSTYTYNSTAAMAKDILEGWKRSPHHNMVIINCNMWRNVKWKAMGIGVYGEYADVWFGKEEDPAGEPEFCD